MATRKRSAVLKAKRRRIAAVKSRLKQETQKPKLDPVLAGLRAASTPISMEVGAIMHPLASIEHLTRCIADIDQTIARRYISRRAECLAELKTYCDQLHEAVHRLGEMVAKGYKEPLADP